MAEKPKFYLTTPLYYTNGLPHIGHTYSTIVCDVVRRFKRMTGYNAVLTTGTDEHGVNVERAAQKAGKTPQEFTNELAAEWRKTWDELGLQGDEFIRTTEAKHHRTVQWLFQRCRDNGFIYKGQYRGQYCVFCNMYVPEAGPGDPCPECGRPTETVTEENYFFKLSEFQDRLLRHYREHPEFVRPETRRNEVVSFVESGLRDLSITRTTITWGIPVPGEAPHVFYVWFDALIGYLSAVGGPDYARRGLWPANLHLVGKEILRFHAVYWPAFLMAAGLPLPQQIWAHGWLLFEQDKMSKSRGNVIRPGPIVETLGMDPLRYFLLREIPFGQDGNFSFDALITRYNSDLANDLGNLSSRVLTMIGRYFGHEFPYPSPLPQRLAQDRQIAELATQAVRRYTVCFERMEFTSGLEAVWELIGAVNKYLVDTEPWTLAERNRDADRSHLATILYTAADALRLVTGLLWPVMPEATAKIWQQLGQTADLSTLSLEALTQSSLSVGDKIGKVEPVFPRLGKQETLQKLFRLQEQAAQQGAPTKPAPAPASATPASGEKLPLEEFLKWDLRVGEVLVAERVKGAAKLLRLEVDIGTEVRQILAGIAEAYSPEALRGRKVVILANLQPRKLRGLESSGMLIAASVGKEDRPVLVTFTEDVPNGARLR